MGLGDEKNQFTKRLKRLDRKNRDFERGFTTQLRSDGLLIVKPKRRVFGISGKTVILFLAAFIGFKGLAVAHMGPTTYEDRLAQLEEGTVIEQGAAWVMQPDPASLFVAGHLNKYLK